MSAEAAETVSPGQVHVLDEARLGWSVLRLAWPVIIQQVSLTTVQLVDTALVGHLGEDALAGVRLGSQIFWFSQGGMFAVSIGTIAVVARNVGAGQVGLASMTLRNALFMAMVWGVAVALGWWFLADWSLGMMGAEAGAQHQGAVYMRAAAVGLPLVSVLFVGSAALQGAGDTRSPMVIAILANLANLIVAVLLINGLGPFPRLNVLGSGAGFASAGIVGAVLVLAVLASGRRIIHWPPGQAFELDGGESKRILNVGIPAGLEQTQFSFAFLIYTRIVASLGTTALAAHGVTIALQNLTYGLGLGLSVAASSLVGQSLGAQRPDLAQRSAYTTLRFTLLLMVGMGIILMALGNRIMDAFVGGAEAGAVIDLGGRLLFIFAFAMPGLAVSLALGGSLRGAGDTRSVLVIMAICTWILRLLPAYLLAIPLGLGVPGAWAASVLDINSRGLLIWLRFKQGSWKHIKV